MIWSGLHRQPFEREESFTPTSAVRTAAASSMPMAEPLFHLEERQLMVATSFHTRLPPARV